MNSFFRNRYGFDRLNLILALLALVFIFSRILWPISVLLLAALAFRATSRNLARRQMELRRFETSFAKVSGFLDRIFRPLAQWSVRMRSKSSQNKTHKYVKCRYCKKKLRLPRHKGKIKVTCPECKNQFIIKT